LQHVKYPHGSAVELPIGRIPKSKTAQRTPEKVRRIMRIARLLCFLLLAIELLTIPVQSRSQVVVGVSVRIGPPALPVYEQPICPGLGFLWVPGYWAYGSDGYFWVPGTWVEPPEVGLLWTPGYWAWENDAYRWHAGYWGSEVGFYGGINYGFGYTGVGFFGGSWRGREFFYNRAVTNVNVTVVRNTYNTTVVNNTTVNRVSFNGGPGGVSARPTSREITAEHQRHVTMTAEQSQHQQAASSNRTLLASVNHGRPDVAASPRPGQFESHGAVEARTPVNPNRPPANVRGPAAAPNAAPVNPALEQKHQQQMDRLRQQQDQERQRVEQKHQQEQQKLQQQAADANKQQDTQRRQQQQLQQLQQKHEQQQQKLQQKQQQERQRQQKPEKPPAPSKPHDEKPTSQQ
jgi:hypothetical protein